MMAKPATLSSSSATVRLTPSTASEPFQTTYGSTSGGSATRSQRLPPRPARRNSRTTPRPSTCPCTQWPPSSAPARSGRSRLTRSPERSLPRRVRRSVSGERSAVNQPRLLPRPAPPLGSSRVIVRQQPLTAMLSPSRRRSSSVPGAAMRNCPPPRPARTAATVPTASMMPVNMYLRLYGEGRAKIAGRASAPASAPRRASARPGSLPRPLAAGRRAALRPACGERLARLQAREAVHVRLQSGGNEHGTVGLLEIFEDGDPGAPDRQAVAVERVRESGLALGVAHFDVGAAGLEILAVAARGDLAIGLLRGQPDLEVVGLGGAEAEVGGAKGDDAIGQLERLQHGLGIGGETLELVVGVGGIGDLHQFDLLELVLADDAARVLAVRAGLAAKAGRPGGDADGQRGGVEHGIGEQIGQRHLGGGNQPQVRVFTLEEVGGELRQLAGPAHGLGVDERGRKDLGVAVATGVEIEHEVGEGALEAGAGAAIDGEARAGDLGRGGEVEHAQALAQFDVIARGEVEGARRAPAADLDVVLRGAAGGHAGVRQVGDRQEQRLKVGFELALAGFERGDLLVEPARTFALRVAFFCRSGLRGGAAAGGEFGRQGLAAIAQRIERGDGRAAVGVQRAEAAEVGGGAAPGEPRLDLIEMLADESGIEHGSGGGTEPAMFQVSSWRRAVGAREAAEGGGGTAAPTAAAPVPAPGRGRRGAAPPSPAC